MNDTQKTIAKRLSTISEKWGNYRTETSKGMRELCMDFEWLLTTCEQLVSELDSEREESRKLREDREKLIEGLRTCLMHAGSWDAEDYVSCLRDILKEIGVTVDV